MKILFLGDSGGSGNLNDGPTWTEVMRELLAEEFNEPVEVEHKIFIATGEKPRASLSKLSRSTSLTWSS